MQLSACGNFPVRYRKGIIKMTYTLIFDCVANERPLGLHVHVFLEIVNTQHQPYQGYLFFVDDASAHDNYFAIVPPSGDKLKPDIWKEARLLTGRSSAVSS